MKWMRNRVLKASPRLLLALAALAQIESLAQQPPQLPPPSQWIEARRGSQVEAAKAAGVFAAFQFTNKVTESGIGFYHRAVADANKAYKPIHYDHGTGLAIADVDGDGRLDIYFVGQVGGNQLWRNRGGGRFENITASAGVGLQDRICATASFADIDNDGDPDLFATTVRFGNALFENLGQGRFRDITTEAGVPYIGHSSGAVFFDYDKDGYLDLFLCNIGRYTTDQKGPGGYFIGMSDGFKGHLVPERSEQSILYRNLGAKKFRNVSNEVLQHSAWSGDATFMDFNDDGFPDLYVLNMQGDDRYYENQQGKRFVERTAAYFPKTPWGAMGIKSFDFNQDGRMDLFLTDMHSDMSKPQLDIAEKNVRVDFEKQKSEAWCTTGWTEEFLQGSSNNIFGNAFYVRQTDGRFVESSDRLGTETFWPWGVSVADLNADGYEDLFVTAGMGFGFRYALNSVLLNHRGERFLDSELLLGVEPRSRTDKIAFILDCSGVDKDHPLCAGLSGKVNVREALSSRSAAIFDLDDDGDLDILTNDINDRPQVLVSNLAERKRLNFVKVRLVGTRSNRDGLGATVKVRVGGKTLTQFHDGKSGYLSQSSLPLYFGLGDAGKIETITVLWPSGKKQLVEKDLAANRTLTITEER
jgi:enediyne biosynthesis protein E4